MIPGNIISALFSIDQLGIIIGISQPLNGATLLLATTAVSGGTNNNFIDLGANALAVTRNGTTTQGSFSPYSTSGWSAEFNGLSDYLSLNGVTPMGSGDWTVELSVNLISSVNAGIFELSTASGGFQASYDGGQVIALETNSSGALVLYINNVGRTLSTVKSNALLDIWHHIAIVKRNNGVYFYLNGVQDTSFGTGGMLDGSANYPGSNIVIGGSTASGASGSAYLARAYISNFRMVKGTAIYTGNFTPPSTPLIAVAGTTLLILQDSRFKDNSIYNLNSIFISGFPKLLPLSYAQATSYDRAINGSSMQFNASSDSLSVVGLSLGGADFTIEANIYPLVQPSGTAPVTLISGESSGSGVLWSVILASYNGFQGLSLAYGVYGTFTCGTTTKGNWLRAFTWNHVAITRTSGFIRIFVNGVSQTLTVYNENNTFDPTFNINASGKLRTLMSGLIGYASDVRIVAGVSAYVNNFTPPALPVAPHATGTTILLLSGGNANLYDAAGKSVFETRSGAITSTAVSRTGGLSVSLPATSNGVCSSLRVYDSFALNFRTANFTVEGWFYRTSSAGLNTLFSIGDHRSGGMMFRTDQFIFTTSNPVDLNAFLPVNAWFHVAVVRSGTNLRVYINGINKFETTTGDSHKASVAYIGAAAIAPNTQGFIGYVEAFRVTNGSARYLNNFIPV